jgi:hypothetical protein
MNDYSPRSPSGRRDRLAGDSFAGDSDDASRELEYALATLRPSAGGIDRDRLMFLAGRAMVERPGVGGMMLAKWMWPSATAISTVAATVLGLLLAMSHRPLVVREPVYVHAPGPSHPAPLPPFQPQPGGGLPGETFVEGSSAMPGVTVSPDAAAEVATGVFVARADMGRIDYVPRTTLPPANYVQKRQIAISLGVEALGSGTAAGGAEHPVAYRELLEDMVRGN